MKENQDKPKTPSRIRAEKCAKEIQSVLDKHSCTFVLSLEYKPEGIFPVCAINALAIASIVNEQ